MSDLSLDDVVEAVSSRLSIDARQAWPGVLRPEDLARYLGVSKVRVYQLVKTEPNFPRQIRYTNRCVGWRRASVDAWLRAKEGGAA